MSSPPRSREREEERRLSIRTLAIASSASATAAVVTSQFWTGGTPIAAAVTPVIVALVSELLHRPTEAIARRVTYERPAILPEAGAAAPPAEADADRLPERAPSEPGSEPEREAPVRVYRGQPARRRRKIAVGVVVTTAVLAFAIAAAALTIPELITGGSIGKSSRHTTLFGGKKNRTQPDTQQPTTPTAPGQQPGTQTTPQEEQPKSTTPKSTTPKSTTPKSKPKPRTETAPAKTESQTTPKKP